MIQRYTIKDGKLTESETGELVLHKDYGVVMEIESQDKEIEELHKEVGKDD